MNTYAITVLSCRDQRSRGAHERRNTARGTRSKDHANQLARCQKWRHNHDTTKTSGTLLALRGTLDGQDGVGLS